MRRRVTEYLKWYGIEYIGAWLYHSPGLPGICSPQTRRYDSLKSLIMDNCLELTLVVHGITWSEIHMAEVNPKEFTNADK